jgi:hypothetical protein
VKAIGPFLLEKLIEFVFDYLKNDEKREKFIAEIKKLKP